MSDSNKPLFFDLDPRTGQPTPTTYESMRVAMLGRQAIPVNVPDDIKSLLLIAIDYFALAYEQANIGRLHLYGPLTNVAFTKLALALELALRRRLRRGNSVSLDCLFSAGTAADILPSTDEHDLLWTELRKNRNSITHGNATSSSYGPSTGRWIELVIDAVVAMYASVIVEPSSGNTARSI